MSASLNASNFLVACDEAVTAGRLIRRLSQRDKEYAVQDWISDRLGECGVDYVQNGRNTYPDFWINQQGQHLVGIESKGLTFPGRARTFDGNSRLASGEHDGAPVYYAFARYPKTRNSEYAVSDLVVFHSDLLNPPSEYTHENKNVPVFGGYADVMIRDRKMYVLKTPYELLDGLANAVTFIAPANEPVVDGLTPVGSIKRVEAEETAVAYRFDLRTNELEVEMGPNPTAGKRHTFTAYQKRSTGTPVTLATTEPIEEIMDEES
jgi:hypothetical protein